MTGLGSTVRKNTLLSLFMDILMLLKKKKNRKFPKGNFNKCIFSKLFKGFSFSADFFLIDKKI